MKMNSSKGLSAWEWLLLAGVAVVVIAATEYIGIQQKWEDAIVFTVVLFAAVTVSLRRLWTRRTFWRNLALLFMLHLLLATVAVGASGIRRHGYPKLLLIIAGMIEGVLLITVLWNTTPGNHTLSCDE